MEETFEQYWDETHKALYFYNPNSKETTWHKPESSKVIDKTTKKQQAEMALIASKQQRQEKIKKLQQENLDAMYPEFYKDGTGSDAVALI